jgi:hypothetical protein
MCRAKSPQNRWQRFSITNVQKLVEMGCVEMQGDEPVMTSAGAHELDVVD